MKKLIPLIALLPLTILALTPPWEFHLDCTVNSMLWLWAVLISGFLAFLFIYTKVSVWLKLLVVWCFISCFLSRAPYMSFTMFWSVIACAYYYALCRHITDWSLVHKAIQSIFFLVALLIIMQLFGKDTLLNFNTKTPAILGLIGNKMILSTFVCVLAPFLIINPLNWVALSLIAVISTSSGAVLALGMGGATLMWFKVKRARWTIVGLIIGILAYTMITGDFKTFAGKAGRRPVWVKTAKLTLDRPLGYGIGTYKVLFPVLCGKAIRDQQPGKEWNTAHNDFLQIPFEVGIPGFILLAGWIISIVRKVKNPLQLAGMMILAGVMAVHFPMRMVQSTLIMLMFIAYLERKQDVNCH